MKNYVACHNNYSVFNMMCHKIFYEWVSPKDLFHFPGDAELTLDLKNFIQGVLCTQVCHVYFLNLKNYERLVVKRNKTTMDLMRELAETKLQSRMRRLQPDQIPLLRTLLYKMQRIARDIQDKEKRKAQKVEVEETSYDIVPQRGALINLYGPGTIFHRSKLREKAKKKKNNLGNFRGATTLGFGLHVNKEQSHTEQSKTNHQAGFVTERTFHNGAMTGQANGEDLLFNNDNTMDHDLGKIY